MRKLKKSICILTVLQFLIVPAIADLCMAITIAEEEELSREFMKVIFKRFDLIEDPYIVKYVNSVGKRILQKLPPQNFPYKFYVINSDVYNAFATPAGHIFIYRGLIEAMDSEDELAGILGHEIAHVQCRHISDKIDRSTKMNLATLAGMAAGIFLGAGGAGAAGQALTVGSVAAAQSMELAYSREDEIQADKIGLDNLTSAGYDGKALMTTLDKIRSKRWFDSVPTYLTTHPAAEDRIAYIDSWSQNHRELPSKGPTPGFRKARARLLALYGDENKAEAYFKREVEKNPDDSMAHYGYGLILARTGARGQAAVQLKTALESNPLDSSILGELGRVYFLEGRLQDADATLRGAMGLSGENPETQFYLARTQMELGKLAEAASSFEKLIESHSDYDQAYYFLGECRGKMGNLPDAHYYLGLYYFRKHDPENALFHLTKAMETTDDPQRRERIENLLKTSRENQAELRKEKQAQRARAR